MRLPEMNNFKDGNWAVLINKPEMTGIYGYYISRLDAERVAQALDGWVLKNGLSAQAVAERLILFPEKDLGSRRG